MNAGIQSVLVTNKPLVERILDDELYGVVAESIAANVLLFACTGGHDPGLGAAAQRVQAVVRAQRKWDNRDVAVWADEAGDFCSRRGNTDLRKEQEDERAQRGD